MPSEEFLSNLFRQSVELGVQEHRRRRPRVAADPRKAFAWIKNRKAPERARGWDFVFSDISAMARAAAEAARAKERADDLTAAAATTSDTNVKAAEAVSMTAIVDDFAAIRGAATDQPATIDDGTDAAIEALFRQ